MLDNTNYYENTATNIKEKISAYTTEQTTLDVVNANKVQDDINEYIRVLGNENISEAKTKLLDETNESFLKSFDKYTDKNKTKLANILANVYMSSAFPIDEINMVYRLVLKYGLKIDFLIVVSLVIFASSSVYLYMRKKQCKWLFIAMYNSIAFLSIITIFIKKSSTIFYTNERFSSVINNILKTYSNTMFIYIAGIVVTAIVLNYIKYFRTKIKD